MTQLKKYYIINFLDNHGYMYATLAKKKEFYCSIKSKIYHFYLPHMEYEGSIGFVSDFFFFYCGFTRFRNF
jgi:hypothetical protein